jgi:hypothetical protein
MLVKFGNNARGGQGVDLETEHLHEILSNLFTESKFTSVYELANRYRITQNKNALLREMKYARPRAFCFFINKN